MKTIKLKMTSPLFIFLLLMPHFKPPYIGRIPALDSLFNILRILSALTIFLLYIFRRKISLPLILLLSFESWLFFTTLWGEGDFYTYILRAASDLSVFLICSYMAVAPKNLLKVLLLISEIMTYVNLIAIVLFPQGLYNTDLYWQNWWLGYRNNFFPYFLVFGVVAVLYRYYVGRSIRSIILIFSIFISLVLVNSATALIAMAVFLLLVVFSKVKWATIINSFVLTLGDIVAFFLLVVFRALNWFSFIIVDILHRNITLTGRTLLWDVLYQYIQQKPITGYGVLSNSQTADMLYRTWAVHAHNLVLQYLFNGGIIAIIIFIAFNIYFLRKLYLYRATKTAMLMSIAIFVYYIACLTEPYLYPMIYVVYSMACNIDQLLPYESTYLSPKRFHWGNKKFTRSL